MHLLQKYIYNMSTYCVTCVWWLKLFSHTRDSIYCYCCRGTRVVEWNIEDVNLVTWNMKKEYFSELILFTFIHSLTNIHTKHVEMWWQHTSFSHFTKSTQFMEEKLFFLLISIVFLWISSYRWKRDRKHTTTTTKRCWQKMKKEFANSSATKKYQN